MASIISIRDLRKTYATGFEALKQINLEIERGEIFALLGPNGAGKTTLINIVCGIVNPTSGHVSVAGFDIIRNARSARSLIGLVPQELTTDAFESVWATTSFSRGLFGKPRNDAHIEKTLSHEPRVLFLDEPTAGVDVELRQDMWQLVRELRDSGVTIILTTHYIEEAEQMADRVGVINHGEIVLVEDKDLLMRKLGKKQMTIQLTEPVDELPAALAGYKLELANDGNEIVYTYDTHAERTGITSLLGELNRHGLTFNDLHTTQSSLEDIFVGLVSRRA